MLKLLILFLQMSFYWILKLLIASATKKNQHENWFSQNKKYFTVMLFGEHNYVPPSFFSCIMDYVLTLHFP